IGYGIQKLTEPSMRMTEEEIKKIGDYKQKTSSGDVPKDDTNEVILKQMEESGDEVGAAALREEIRKMKGL
ncbi:hypothetical protein MUP35_01655, partial [Patescibacteria group bacterium]|nr:hypothetical protein [Patescibacteria group bacterium]